jgi:hypothetical protein
VQTPSLRWTISDRSPGTPPDHAGRRVADAEASMKDAINAARRPATDHGSQAAKRESLSRTSNAHLQKKSRFSEGLSAARQA